MRHGYGLRMLWQGGGMLTSEDVPLEVFIPSEGLTTIGAEWHVV